MITEPGNHYYTLVVSQYEKSDTIHYTIRTYRLLERGEFYSQDQTKFNFDESFL